MIFTVAPVDVLNLRNYRQNGKRGAKQRANLTEHMVITCQGDTEQARDGIPGGAVLLVTNGGVLQEAVAAASNQTGERKGGR